MVAPTLTNSTMIKHNSEHSRDIRGGAVWKEVDGADRTCDSDAEATGSSESSLNTSDGGRPSSSSSTSRAKGEGNGGTASCSLAVPTQIHYVIPQRGKEGDKNWVCTELEGDTSSIYWRRWRRRRGEGSRT